MLMEPILRRAQFYMILFSTKVLTCSICYCHFWWSVHMSNSWFLYVNKFPISYAMIYSQLRFIIPKDGFIKSFIFYLRRFPLI